MHKIELQTIRNTRLHEAKDPQLDKHVTSDDCQMTARATEFRVSVYWGLQIWGCLDLNNCNILRNITYYLVLEVPNHN